MTELSISEWLAVVEAASADIFDAEGKTTAELCEAWNLGVAAVRRRLEIGLKLGMVDVVTIVRPNLVGVKQRRKGFRFRKQPRE